MDEETPEQQLQRQAAIARSAQQQQELRQQRLQDLATPDGQVLGYDASIGAYRVQLGDGSIKYALSVTNGALGVSDSVQIHFTSGGMSIDQMPHLAKARETTRSRSQETYCFKVLFALSDATTTRFYIGGDQPAPRKILELPIEYSAGGYITNTGKGAKDWIVGIKYIVPGDNFYTIKSFGVGHEWEELNKPINGSLNYKGWGFWSSELLYSQPPLINTSTNTSQNSTISYYPTDEKVTDINGNPTLKFNYILGASAPIDYAGGPSEIVSSGSASSETSTYGFPAGGLLSGTGSSSQNSNKSVSKTYKLIYDGPYIVRVYGRNYNESGVSTTNKSFNSTTLSTSIYKGILDKKVGSYTSLESGEISSSIIQAKGEHPQGQELSGGYTENQTDSYSGTTQSALSGQIAILPNVYRDQSFSNDSAYSSFSGHDAYIAYFLETNGSFIPFSGESSSSSSASKTAQLFQVYVPKLGTPASYFYQASGQSNNGVGTGEGGSYLLESSETKIESIAVLPNDLTKTNLVKNVFYNSPLEKIEFDPSLGYDVVLPPDYVAKNTTIEGKKYVVDAGGVVTETIFKDKIYSLKIKPSDNYALYGVSYYKQ